MPQISHLVFFVMFESTAYNFFAEPFFPLPSSMKSLKIGKFSTTNRFEIEAKGSPIPAKSVANWARRMICKFQVHIETQKPLQQYPFGARQQESIRSNRKFAKFAFPKIAFTHSCWAAGRLNLDGSWISRFWVRRVKLKYLR